MLLDACETVDVVVDQLGIDLVVALRGPDGQELIAIDSPNGEHGVEGLVWAAEIPGIHILEVRAPSGAPRPGSYVLTLRSRHPATDRDRRLMAGEDLFAKGYALTQDESAGAQRRAVEILDESLAIFQEQGDQYREGLALVATALSDHNYLGQSARAVGRFERAIAIWRKLGERRLEAESLIGLGIARYRLQHMGEAIAIFEEGLAMDRELGDVASEGQVLSNLAMVYDAIGEKERALEYFRAALQILRKTGNLQVELWTQNNLAALYEFRGELQKALGSYEGALVLCRRVSARKDESRVLANLGRLYGKLGEEERGELCLRQAAAIARELKDPDAEAAALRSIARSQFERGDVPAAIATDEAALGRAREAKDARFQTIILNALSASVASRGNARRALALAEEALSLARSGGNRFNEGLAEMNLGVARAGLGQVEEARADFQKALEIRRAIGDRMGVAETDLALARLERDDGRLEPSLVRARQGLEILESLRTEILGHDMRASFFGTLQRHYGFALDLLMRMHSADPRRGFDALALETAERARARSLLDLLSEGRAGLRLGIDPALLTKERMLRNEIGSRLDAQVRLLSGPHTEEKAAAAAAALDALRLERQRLEEEILRSNPRYADVSQPRPSTAAEIQSTLGEDTLLLEYAFGEEKDVLWAVSAGGRSSHVLAPATEVKAAARHFYDLLSARNQRLRFESANDRAKPVARADAECSGRSARSRTHASGSRS